MGIHRLRGSLVLLLLLLAFLLPQGCSNDETTSSCTGPDGQALSGRITGRAIGGTGPMSDVGIQIEGVDTSHPITIETYTDSTGTYDLAVRPGSYTVAALLPPRGDIFPQPPPRLLYYRTGGVVVTRDEAELITVGCETRSADLVFGTLQLRFSFPADLHASGGAYCEAVREGEPSFLITQSSRDSAGVRRATFPIVPPGVYRVACYAWPFSVWLRGALSPSSADTLRIGPGSFRLLQSTLTVHRFSGSVTGSWQQVAGALPRVSFYADNPRTARPVFEVETDPQGDYSGLLLAPGAVRMRVRIGSVANWLGAETWENAESIEIPQSGDVRIPAYVESGIKCRIAGLSPGGPGEVELESATGELRAGASSESTCFFPNLAAGTYYLSVRPETPSSLSPQWFDRAASRETATPIVVPGGGSLVPIDVTLERGATLSGHVLRAEGTPPGVFTSLLIWTERFGYDRDERASSDGSFRVEGLPRGKVKLGAYHGTPAVLTWYPGTPDESQAQEFDIQGQEEISNIEFRL